MRRTFERWACRIAPTVTAGVITLVIATAALAKDDIGPSDSGCDAVAKSGTAWTGCLGEASADLSDAELFYAGYWLARSGAYREALSFLERANSPDERILTYAGFATRKLGNLAGAFAYYEKALERNPDYVVARAYMGEAFLARGEPAKAEEQLGEIADRCGVACVEYAELASAIAAARPPARG